MRPVVHNEYSKIMDFVDKADQATMANLSRNRKKHWSTAEMVWVVTMLLTMNAKKLFKSASGKVIERGKEWRDYLIDCLFDCTLGDKKIILLLNLTRSQGCPDATRAVSLAKNESAQHGNVKFVGQSVSHVRWEERRVSTKLTGSF